MGEPLSLMAKFDMAAASGRKKSTPLVSIHQALRSRALTAEILIRGQCMVEGKVEEMDVLQSDIKKLKKSIAMYKTHKLDNKSAYRDAIKECKQISDKLQKKIITIENANKIKNTTLSSTISRINHEHQRHDMISTSHSKLDDQISMLLINSQHRMPLDNSSSIQTMVDSEISRKHQYEIDIDRMINDKKQLCLTIDTLDDMIQDVTRVLS